MSYLFNRFQGSDSYKVEYEKMNRALEMISNHMAQSFLRKQKTREYQKTQFKKTGILDTQSLSKHKISEDIFIRRQIDHKGDSYGFVLLFDMSGSMGTTYLPCILQILLFAKFCKKASLPFEVYGFSDYSASEYNPFSSPSNRCRLYNFLSSSSSKQNFEKQSRAFYYLARSAASSTYGSNGYGLSGTPLNNSLMKCFDVIEQFQQKHKRDITQLVVVTDGDPTDYMMKNGSDWAINNFTEQDVITIKYKNRSYFYNPVKLYNELIEKGLIKTHFSYDQHKPQYEVKPAQYHTLVSALRKHFGEKLRCHEFYIDGKNNQVGQIETKPNKSPNSFNTFVSINKSVFSCFDVIQRSDFWSDVESMESEFENESEEFEIDSIETRKPKQVENVKREINRIGRDMSKSLVKTKNLKIISEKIIDLLV